MVVAIIAHAKWSRRSNSPLEAGLVTSEKWSYQAPSVLTRIQALTCRQTRVLVFIDTVTDRDQVDVWCGQRPYRG
jgi:hypothetical protein